MIFLLSKYNFHYIPLLLKNYSKTNNLITNIFLPLSFPLSFRSYVLYISGVARRFSNPLPLPPVPYGLTPSKLIIWSESHRHLYPAVICLNTAFLSIHMNYYIIRWLCPFLLSYTTYKVIIHLKPIEDWLFRVGIQKIVLSRCFRCCLSSFGL